MAQKDPALRTLTLQSDTFSATLYPALGGKIGQLQKDGVELLQQPLKPYALRDLAMGFEESDASGIDECLPSVAECILPDGVFVPDHGEYWRLPCEVTASTATSATLSATGSVLPLRFDRTFTLTANELRIAYRVENVTSQPLPWAWCAHPLYTVDAGDVLTLPESVSEVRLEGSGGGRLGTSGTKLNWPEATLTDGSTTRLDVAAPETSGYGDKLFTAAPAEGWCRIERKQHGITLQIEFDPQLTPWLGLWLCYGGWPEGAANRQNAIAIEPCTAPMDSLAQAMETGYGRTLAPGEAASWWMSIRVRSGS
ncbi:hypothetical protein [Silvibacterium dinghuense]|uniref:Galactose mutarotase n=1 Tax=Silvibacterium dinghuense TaxID=1560006 RepID=A0A4Q1SJB4_9BACT|nr:hypothetical protein [Silvibacterium dinghuense]RXS97523.1 hypothetical protein ESZ00_06440 [Silvibacterium dinghuense]GGG99708.1 hypothetical protein GCM10011586_14090 [Silvibacterium dinghuense]